MAGITQSTASNIIHGNSKNPGIVTIKKLCDAVNMSIQEFFRLAGQLTKEGGYDLPCFWIGSHLKINRLMMINWINDRSDGREDFKTALLKKRIEEFKNGLHQRGRKRKIR